MDIDHLWSLVAVGTLSLVASISPGPDFFIVMRNSLKYSRRIGFITAFGVVMALVVHLTYTLVGIAVLIQENIFIYQLMKYAGAAYLFYLGFSSLRASQKEAKPLEENEIKSSQMITLFAAFKQGFLSNLLNPKAAIFFISLFSQFITADTSTLLKIQYAFVNLAVTFGWFTFFVYMITGDWLIQRIEHFKLAIDKTMGIGLILLSFKIMLI